jgi:hypothetical protein
MSEPTVITPLPDHDSLRGILEIDCAYKFEKGNSTEWHCVSNHSKYEFVVILYHLGYIRVKIGETEFDVTYGDSAYLVGKTANEFITDTRSGEFGKLQKVPKINIHDILTFMEWNYHIGYV